MVAAEAAQQQRLVVSRRGRSPPPPLQPLPRQSHPHPAPAVLPVPVATPTSAGRQQQQPQQQQQLPKSPPARPVSPSNLPSATSNANDDPLTTSTKTAGTANVVPSLKVLIDRTSFDETEDYGVDREALGTTEWGRDHLALGGQFSAGGLSGSQQPPQPIIMRNGKVRRRLKWRPKSMLKKKRQPASTRNSPPPSPGPRGHQNHTYMRSVSASVLPDTLPRGRGSSSVSMLSNDSSVTSEQSSSKASYSSKRSLHSFASLETQVKSNTKKSQRLRFPLIPSLPSNYSMKSMLIVPTGTATNLATLSGESTITTTTAANDADYEEDKRDDDDNDNNSNSNVEVLPPTPRTRHGGKPPRPPQLSPSQKVPTETTACTAAAAAAAAAASSPAPLEISASTDPTCSAEENVAARNVIDTKAKGNKDRKPVTLNPLLKVMGISNGRPRANSTSKLLERKSKHNFGRTGAKIKFPNSKSATSTSMTRTRSSSPASVPGRFQNTPVDASPASVSSCIKVSEQQQSANANPILELSGDDVERDRVVDLRIRVPPPIIEPRRAVSSGHILMDRIVDAPIPRPASTGGGYHRGLGAKNTDFLSIAELRNRSSSSIGGFGRQRRRSLVASPSSHSAFSSPGATDEVAAAAAAAAAVHDDDDESKIVTLRGSFSNNDDAIYQKQYDDDDEDDDDDIRMADPVIGPSMSAQARDRNDSESPFICSMREDEIGVDILSCSVPSSQSEELRFPMVNSAVSTDLTISNEEEHPGGGCGALANKNRQPQVPTTTVPVDLDECCFLEAEKNLQAIHLMASEHLQQGEYDEALEVFEEILRGQLTRYGKDHFRVGTALHNIGIVHMKRKDYEKAVNAYRESVSIRKKALSPDHPDVASSLAQLGVAYLERKMYKKSITTFREALRIRRKYLGPTHPKISKIINNIGCALYELNALPVAKVAFEEALEIQRENLRDSPANDSNQSNYQLLSIASTLSNIASIKLYLNMFDEASVDFQEALLIQQCVFGDEHPIPKQTECSIAWIEESKETHRAAAAAKFSSSSSTGRSNLDLISKLLSASIAEGSKGVLSCTTPATDSIDGCGGSGGHHGDDADDILDAAGGEEGRAATHSKKREAKKSKLQQKEHSPTGVLDSVERQFMDFQSNLRMACGENDDDLAGEEIDENGLHEV